MDCKGSTQAGKTCRRNTLFNSRFCIFHDPLEKDPDRFHQDFLKLIAEPSESGILDATGFVFPDVALHKVEFHHHAVFHRTRFMGKAFFMECTFHRGADFLDASFDGPASFHKSILRSPGGFQRATFRGVAEFAGAQFEGGCDFVETQFLDRAIFASARFMPTVHDGQPFGYFVFMDAAFRGPVDFSLARFDRATTFRGARFSDTAEFRSVRLPPQAAVERPLPTTGPEPSLDFSRVRLEKVDGVRFSGPAYPFPEAYEAAGATLDLSGVRFEGTDIGRIQFADIRWGPSGGSDQGVVFDESYRLASFEPFGWTGESAEGERLALLYKGLRESYERHLLFAEAGRFHVREMECRRRSLGAQFDARADEAKSGWSRKAWRTIARLRRRTNLLEAYRLTSNYGESYVRAFWSIVVWFLLVAGFEALLRPRWFPRPLGWAHAVANRAIALMPAQVAGDSLTDFVGRLVGVFLITGFVIALRRHFRR